MIFSVNANACSISILSILPSIPTTICSDYVCASRSPVPVKHTSPWHSDSIAIFIPNCKRSLRTLKRISLSCIQRFPVPLRSIRLSSYRASVIPADPKRTPGVDRFRRMLTCAQVNASRWEERSRTHVCASFTVKSRTLVPRGMSVGWFYFKASVECDIFAGHYNNKDSAEGTVGLLSSLPPPSRPVCVRARARAGVCRPTEYIPGDPRICIPPPVTPRSPCTRFLISPLTNPFCTWIAAVMDTVWAHSANKPCFTRGFFPRPPSLPPFVLVNYCL